MSYCILLSCNSKHELSIYPNDQSLKDQIGQRDTQLLANVTINDTMVLANSAIFQNFYIDQYLMDHREDSIYLTLDSVALQIFEQQQDLAIATGDSLAMEYVALALGYLSKDDMVSQEVAISVAFDHLITAFPLQITDPEQQQGIMNEAGWLLENELSFVAIDIGGEPITVNPGNDEAGDRRGYKLCRNSCYDDCPDWPDPLTTLGSQYDSQIIDRRNCRRGCRKHCRALN